MGTLVLSDYRAQVKHYVQLTATSEGPGTLSDGALDAFIAEAIAEHARFRPRLVTDQTLDGTGVATMFRLDNLAVAFEDGFSALRRVEYPTGNTPRTFVDPNTYQVDRNSSGQVVLEFLEVTPVSGIDNIRLEYTARHTLSDSTSSLLDADFYAVCHLAAALALVALAGQAAHSVDSSISASERGPRTASDVYRAVAKEHRVAYFAHFGQTEQQMGETPAASVTREWDSSFVWGTDRLTHRRAWL